jgi:quercetin dioxygenase-like cupin family protein
MKPDGGQGRRSPRERFAGAEHLFDLRKIAARIRDESTPVRDGHRQMTIFHKQALTLVVFDFETGGRLADHHAEADVTILALTGRLQVSTPTETYQLPEGSALVLDPGVRHDVYAPEGGQMLLAVARIAERTPDGS